MRSKNHGQSRGSNNKTSTQESSLVVYYLLVLLGFGLIAVGVWIANPSIINGFNRLPDFMSLTWAHDSVLLKSFLELMGMSWLVVSAFFWGGWVIRRAYRKIRGLCWRIKTEGMSKIAPLFPPVLNYLKFSCYYLIVVLLFVILQYPLQFMLFSN